MSKWYCELSESYHDTLEEAQDVCREYIDAMDYHEHVMDIEPGRIFQALYSPKMAEEVLYEIINNTETYYFKNYITECENEEDEEDENF